MNETAADSVSRSIAVLGRVVNVFLQFRKLCNLGIALRILGIQKLHANLKIALAESHEHFVL